MATQGKKLLDFVIGIHDPRVTGRTDHDLVDILVLALCAVMAGAEGWDDIEDWGLENEADVAPVPAPAKRDSWA